MITLVTQYMIDFYALSLPSVLLVGHNLNMLLLTLPLTIATCEHSSSMPRASIHRAPGAWAEAVIWVRARAP